MSDDEHRIVGAAREALLLAKDAQIARLTAERDAALTLVASAYEAASDYAWSACKMCGDTDARAIRALTPADALAAQAARDERMRAEGARAALTELNDKVQVIRLEAGRSGDGVRFQALDDVRQMFREILEARAALKENGDE